MAFLLEIAKQVSLYTQTHFFGGTNMFTRCTHARVLIVLLWCAFCALCVHFVCIEMAERICTVHKLLGPGLCIPFCKYQMEVGRDTG